MLIRMQNVSAVLVNESGNTGDHAFFVGQLSSRIADFRFISALSGLSEFPAPHLLQMRQ